MKSSVISYRTRPDKADENQRLVEAVFAELAAKKPAGFSYNSFRLSDGVSFVHVVSGDGAGLGELAAFQQFQQGLADRLESGPDREEGTRVGGYTG
jgi:hypothetical protein